MAKTLHTSGLKSSQDFGASPMLTIISLINRTRALLKLFSSSVRSFTLDEYRSTAPLILCAFLGMKGCIIFPVPGSHRTS